MSEINFPNFNTLLTSRELQAKTIYDLFRHLKEIEKDSEAYNALRQEVQELCDEIRSLDPSMSEEEAIQALAAKQAIVEADLSALGPRISEISEANDRTLTANLSNVGGYWDGNLTFLMNSSQQINAARVAIPDGTTRLHIRLSLPAVTGTGTYAAYVFSSSYSASQAVMSSPVAFARRGTASEIDDYVNVPSDAKYLFVATTQGGNALDVITSGVIISKVAPVTTFAEGIRTFAENLQGDVLNLAYKSLTCAITNISRCRMADTLDWGSNSVGLNVARIDLPEGAGGKRLFLSFSNHIVGSSSFKGYLAFWFSANSSGSGAYISNAGEETVPNYSPYNISKYLVVPATAKYVFVTTTQGSAAGDVISNVTAMIGGNDIKAEITSLESRVSNIETNGFPITGEIALPLLTKVGYLVSSDNGSLVASTYSQYLILDVANKGYKTIRIMLGAYTGNYGYGFFLSDNSWVGVHTTNGVFDTYTTINVPDNAVEFRACWSTNYVRVPNWVFVTTDSSIKDYVDGKVNVKAKTFPIDFKFDLSIITPPSVISYNSVSLSDFYAMYDALMASYPNYITKVDCSDADTEISVERPSYLNNLPIYLYKFCPNKYASHNIEANEFINVMIVTGTHSNEKLGMFIIYYMMKMICEQWNTNSDLCNLRQFVNFYIIPCLNPWGYVNAGVAVGDVAIPGRCNGNGVNINRNFPTANWYASGAATDSDGNYSGPSAGSEYETQICMYYANALNIDIFHDAHTGNMNVHGAFGVVECYDRGALYDMGLVVARTTAARLIALDSNFPDDADTRLIDSSVSLTLGGMYRWAAENVTRYSFLSEQSIESKYLNGVLTTSIQEDASSSLIWQMNLVAQYNYLMRMIKAYVDGL